MELYTELQCPVWPFKIVPTWWIRNIRSRIRIYGRPATSGCSRGVNHPLHLLPLGIAPVELRAVERRGLRVPLQCGPRRSQPCRERSHTTTVHYGAALFVLSNIPTASFFPRREGDLCEGRCGAVAGLRRLCLHLSFSRSRAFLECSDRGKRVRLCKLLDPGSDNVSPAVAAGDWHLCLALPDLVRL